MDAIGPIAVGLRTGTAPLVRGIRAETVVMHLLLRRCWVEKLLVSGHVVHVDVVHCCGGGGRRRGVGWEVE